MNVLMLTSRFGFGYGMGYSSYKEAIALVSLGHSVTVVHCYSSPEIEQFYDSRITSIYVPIKKIPLIGFLVYFFKLRKLMIDKIIIKKFDVVYVQSLEFGLLDLARIEAPIFYFARSTMRGMAQALRDEKIKTSLFLKLTTFVLIALERRCMRFSKRIFVKSLSMLREAQQLYGVDKDKVVVIAGGIDSEDFQIKSEPLSLEFKRELGISLDIPVFLYAGRIVPQKGLLYLVKASLALLQETNFVVIIAGAIMSNSYYAEVKNLIDKSAYPSSFYFLGHIDQRKVPLVFNLSDCLVAPSLYEPFGMVNLQAAFLNKEIITTEAAGSIELLANYEKMKVVKSGSATALALAMREVLSIKKTKKQNNFDFSIYSWHNVAQQLIHHFKA